MVAPLHKKLSQEDKLAILHGAFIMGITPPERLDLDEWCDKYYYLPKATSAEHGLWRTSRFEFLRRPMKCLSDSSIAKEVVVIKGAQLGFTEILKAWSLYIADHCPAPSMYVQKTQLAAEEYSKQKLQPTIELCEKVHETMGDGKPKNLSNTTLDKGFPGGFLVMGGANTGAFLRSKSIKNAAADEEDSFKADIDQEGSPIAMIRKRLANFSNSKFARISTPKFLETSTIEPGYKRGSMEQYYVPCPDCNPRADKGGTYFVIEWANIKFSDELNDIGQPKDIELQCTMCGCLIPETKKFFMIENGIWMSTKNSDDIEHPLDPYEVGDVEYPSFQISSLYSPGGFFSWREAWIEFNDYKTTKDTALLQVFVNQTLGETYTVSGSDVSPNWLLGRSEDYKAEVPMGGLVLTCGADVQKDRIECEVVAWGVSGESWGITYKVFWGDTSMLGDYRGRDSNGNPTPWKQFDDFLKTRFQHEGDLLTGAKPWMTIEMTFVDEGYLTEIVNVFCRQREAMRIYPIKGRSGWGKGLAEKPMDRNKKYHTWRYTAWTDALKQHVYKSLEVTEFGATYCHFPANTEYNKKYFKGLTAEKLETKRVAGKTVLYWYCPKNARNEPLDVRGYNLAAINQYPVNLQYRQERITNLLIKYGIEV